MRPISDSFHGLGTDIEGCLMLDGSATDSVWSLVRQQVAAFEERFSRFRDDSELSAVNRSAGTPIHVSDAMLGVLRAARAMWQLTDGRVDPTVGNALRAAGYRASFDTLAQQGNGPVSVVARHSFADVVVDDTTGTVTVPQGTTLDFGGIGKGYLLDQLRPLIERSTDTYWISLGGDLIASTPAGSEPWIVGIQDPFNLNDDRASLIAPRGTVGIATSGTMKRRGTYNGKHWHHIIDPRTGEPAVSTLAAVTVIAPTALEADCAAKTILLQGPDAGMHWARAQGIDVYAVSVDGQTIMTQTFPIYNQVRV